jgi:hypothetical protein
MNIITLLPIVGSFAENKDKAREIRENIILPTLSQNDDIIIDFDGIDGATQSFVHALISETIRQYGSLVLDKISFKNCNDSVKEIIKTVTEYMQES